VVQMDFFLPDGSPLLYARMRLTNPNDQVIPMYWWSNIAVEEKEGNRVVVPANQSYTQYNGTVMKIPVPEYNGIDYTYPTNNVTAIDYFWKTEEGAQKYIFQGDKEGYGLFQTSTARLKGRKLFVWGNSQGGRKWMNFLTADNEQGRYNEIQCGLAYTQYESLPMPPHTVWEWLETYGALQVDAKNLQKEWSVARRETEEKIAQKLSGVDLENLLRQTLPMAKGRATEVLYRGDGWGALELKEKGLGAGGLMCEHLDFGETDEEQAAWVNLLKNGSLGVHSPDSVPVSYCLGENWRRRIEAALQEKDRDNWYAFYQAGVLALATNRWDEAESLLKKSFEIEANVWAEYALAILYRKTGAHDKEITFMLSAFERRKNDVFLAKEVFYSLYTAERSEETISLYENADEKIRENKRCILYYAFALARTGDINKAEKLLYKDEPLIIPDMRECETSTVDLWNLITERKGMPHAEPPKEIDFRMFAELENWINENNRL
ncbi:MAG: tetratricopeptide repeat protein, partial [Candidatus Scatosoma sp.]